MKNILFLEPNKILGDTYFKFFSAKGFSVRIVSSAQDAITICDELTPDLVIIEIQLKKHNGIDFIYEFRSYPDWQSVPIIIQSMVPPREFPIDKKFWKDLNVVNYFYKPKMKLSNLLSEVNYFFSESVI
jgi:DNA-binding response OmpR family regulator